MAEFSFKFRERTIPIKLTYKEAYTDLPRLGLPILDMFEEGSTVVQDIMLNDKTMLKVWHFFINREVGGAGELEEILEYLEPEQMQKFKEVFWDATVNFMPSQVRDTLKEAWKQVQKMLKSPDLISGSLSSSSQPEPE